MVKLLTWFYRSDYILNIETLGLECSAGPVCTNHGLEPHQYQTRKKQKESHLGPNYNSALGTFKAIFQNLEVKSSLHLSFTFVEE